MEGERVVFFEEGGPTQYVKLIASGVMDESLLEALEDYIKRQKKRLTTEGGLRIGGKPVGGVCAASSI